MTLLILLAIAVIIAIIIIVTVRASKRGRGIFESPSRRAGRRGEEAAAEIIDSVLRGGNHHFTNVQISFDGKPAELDDVVVNKYGVFIIEVKNYVGRLYGDEDDFEWSKCKTTDAGNVYEKTVKNPIKQVKRQTYILARFLDSYGIKVWVEGRAMLLHGNSPVRSPYMLNTIGDIDRLLHTFDRNHLKARTVDAICKLIS